MFGIISDFRLSYASSIALELPSKAPASTLPLRRSLARAPLRQYPFSIFGSPSFILNTSSQDPSAIVALPDSRNLSRRRYTTKSVSLARQATFVFILAVLVWTALRRATNLAA